MSVINECSYCLEQSYLFDRVDINHVGVNESGQGKDMTRVCRLRSVLGCKSVHVCSVVCVVCGYPVCVREGGHEVELFTEFIL